MQINRLDKAQTEGRPVQIRMSVRQVAKNVSYTGGFFAAFAPLIARALPLAAPVLPLAAPVLPLAAPVLPLAAPVLPLAARVLPLAARVLPLAARVLPTIMPGLTTGLLSGGVHKAISGNGVVGYGLYLHKHDKCYRVQKLKGNGLYLAPHSRFVEGDGLFPKHGNNISDGAGLLMGKNSSFKNIPVLGWLL